MKDLTTISSDLFNKIRSRFSDIKIGDADGGLTTDPAEARFFDVNFKIGNTVLGRVNIKVDDAAITVIYNNAMVVDQAKSTKDEWFNFLKDIRQFARKNLLTFDTRDITKSNLEKRDYQYLAQQSGESKMSESKLFGTSKTSYQDIGEATIIVKHNRPVNYNLPAGRTQHIDAIYIESSSGERFRYPHRHLNGARAMARHIANGGTVYDSIGQYISGLSEELGKLRQFKNYTQRSGVMAEALGDISERVVDRIENIKLEISNLQKQGYYEQFKEEFTPKQVQEVPEDTINSWVDALTIRTFNEELKLVFPYIYNLVSETKADEGLTYEDITVEDTDICPECQESPCVCGASVSEHSLMLDFESYLDNVSKLDCDIIEAESKDDQQDDNEPPFDADEKKSKDVTPGKYGQEYSKVRHLARQGMQSVIPKEVVEFIGSMYDRQLGTFPRGEEGVKIAVEKRFGEQAGRFAHYVVEKLSSKEQGCSVDESNSRVEDGLRQLAQHQDYDELYDLLTASSELGYTVQKMYDDVAGEHRLHPDDDHDKILDLLMDRIVDDYSDTDLDSEDGDADDAYALTSAGHGSDEDYGDYGHNESADLVSIRKLAGL